MTSEANQPKLEIVEDLAQLAEQEGMTLIDLAIAFVINHPAVTAAIIGPSTMEQLESQLSGADVTLPDSGFRDRDSLLPVSPRVVRCLLGQPGSANSVTERLFPSGSRNHAIRLPLGAVHTPC